MELILTVLLAPVALALIPLVWKDLISPLLRHEDDPDAPALVQGQPLDLTSVAVKALQDHTESLRAQLVDEQADHARCDTLLRAHDVTVPHD